MSLRMEDVRPRLLPRDLELQLLVGRAVESLYLADAGQSLGDDGRHALQACVERLRQGAAELGTEARTLAQSADAADVVRAAQRALNAIDDRALKSKLSELADALSDLAVLEAGPYADVADKLMQLHDALSEVTGASIEGGGERRGGAAYRC